MKRLTIEKFQTSDFNDLLRLMQELWPDKKLKKSATQVLILEQLNLGNKEFYVAKDMGNIVGFISLRTQYAFYKQSRVGIIDELVVDEKYRDKGVGDSLVKYVMKIAKKKSCKALQLYSALHRKGAHKFYKNHGFKITDYYFSKDIS